LNVEQLINRVQSLGGKLKLTEPDHVQAFVPEDAANLLDELRKRKPEVIEALRKRGGWVANFPECPACGSFCLFRESPGEPYECLTCTRQGISEVEARRRRVPTTIPTAGAVTNG